MKKPKYSKEFREQAIAMMELGDKTLKEISDSLGIGYWTIREWNQERMKNTSNDSPKPKVSEKEELRKLRIELQDLKMENAILKKYAAILAKEKE